MENFRLMLNSTERILNSNRSKEDFQTMFLFCIEGVLLVSINQGGFDGRRQPTASPMLTAIMSGGLVAESCQHTTHQLINSLEQANHSLS